VPKGDVILRPGQSYVSNSASGTSSSPASNATPTTSPQSSPKAAGTSDKTLAIGLGVGISLGLILLGSLLFAAFQFRRFNKARESYYNSSAHMQVQDAGMQKPELQGAVYVRPAVELNA